MSGVTLFQFLHDVISIFGMGSLMAFSLMVLWQSWRTRINQLVFVWMLATSFGLVHAYVVALHARNDLIYDGLGRLFLSGFSIAPSFAYCAITLVLIEIGQHWTSKTRRLFGLLMIAISLGNMINGSFVAETTANPLLFNPTNGYPIITGDISVAQGLIGLYTYGVAGLNAGLAYTARHRINSNVLRGIALNTAWLVLFPFPLLSNLIAPITVISTLLICYGVFVDSVFYPMAAQNELLEKQQADLEKTYASTEALIQQRTMDLELHVGRNQELREQLDHLLSKEVRLGWMKSTIIKMVAQEFEDPLDIIRVQAPDLATNLTLLSPVERSDQTETVRDSISEITGLLDEVVEVERAKPLPEPDYQRITLADLATYLSDSALPDCLPAFVQYRFTLGDPTAEVSVPLAHLTKICAILIEKLYRATKETVELSLERTSQNGLMLMVTNRQIDPPLGSHSRLLELVVRANESRALSGLTLGVYLINRYINQLDGDLSLTAIRNNSQGVLNVLLPPSPVA